MCSQYNDTISLCLFSWCLLGLRLPFSVSQQALVHSHPGIGSFTQIVSSHKTCLMHPYHSSKYTEILVLTWLFTPTTSFTSFLLCWCIIPMYFKRLGAKHCSCGAPLQNSTSQVSAFHNVFANCRSFPWTNYFSNLKYALFYSHRSYLSVNHIITIGNSAVLTLEDRWGFFFPHKLC